MRQAWTCGASQDAFLVAPVTQNQPEPAVQLALCCVFFLLLTGAWRGQMDKKARPGYDDVLGCCGGIS